MMGLDPGALREPLTLQEKREEDDGQGGLVDVWNDFMPEVTLWARVERSPTAKRQRAMQGDTPARYTVTCRAHADLTTGARLRWRTVTLVITGAPQEDTYGELVTFEAMEDRD